MRARCARAPYNLGMDRLLVTGGARLAGTVRISGAKNSALKLMAAALLAPGRSVIENVPRIQDCFTMGDVLAHLGVGVAWDGHTVMVDAADITSVETPYELVRTMRASILVLGPLLARRGRAVVAMPGGCNIGSRTIDLHIKGLEKMGATFSTEHGSLMAATTGLRGASISLDYPSVGATENLLMAAVAATGTTYIENAAREPEIGDLAAFLTAMGAKIDGVGSSTIEIEGTDAFSPARHRTVADRIEAGTFAIAAVATRGDVILDEARPDHLDMVLSKLSEAGADVAVTEQGLRVRQDDRPRSVDFVTLPFPGFATDLQPPMMAMLGVAEGTGVSVATRPGCQMPKRLEGA